MTLSTIPLGFYLRNFSMAKRLSKPKLALLGTLLAGSFLAVGAAFTNTTSSCARGRFTCCNNLPRCRSGEEREKRDTQMGDGFYFKCKTKCACNKVERKERNWKNLLRSKAIFFLIRPIRVGNLPTFFFVNEAIPLSDWVLGAALHLSPELADQYKIVYHFWHTYLLLLNCANCWWLIYLSCYCNHIIG